jgi:hypothetical protein
LETLQTTTNKRISRTTLLNVEIYLFRKTSENEKEHFLHLDNGLNFHKNICADYLGENWQEEYYIWDCAAGTGNLLAGLTNKYNIWASTLDQADVNVMHERIEHGANLLRKPRFSIRLFK